VLSAADGHDRRPPGSTLQVIPNTLICTAVVNRQTDFTPARNRRAHNSTYKAELMIAVGISDIQVGA